MGAQRTGGRPSTGRVDLSGLDPHAGTPPVPDPPADVGGDPRLVVLPELAEHVRRARRARGQAEQIEQAAEETDLDRPSWPGCTGWPRTLQAARIRETLSMTHLIPRVLRGEPGTGELVDLLAHYDPPVLDAIPDIARVAAALRRRRGRGSRQPSPV